MRRGDYQPRDGYTPPALASLAVRAIKATSGRAPKNILEAHAGGGAWVDACLEHYPKAKVLVGDSDPDAVALDDDWRRERRSSPRSKVDRVIKLYEGRLEDNLAEVRTLGASSAGNYWVVGNPDFDEARSQLQMLAELENPPSVIAWMLPSSLYDVQAWSRILLTWPPRFVRPVCQRVWHNVRGVAIWEWWRPMGQPWATQIIPLRYRAPVLKPGRPYEDAHLDPALSFASPSE